MAYYPRPTDRPRSELAIFTRKVLIVTAVVLALAVLWAARAALLLVENAERVSSLQFSQLVVGHGVCSPRLPCRSSRSLIRPLRMRVLIVPSGSFSRSAMSLCDRPL